jgi:putative acetyltransferase
MKKANFVCNYKPSDLKTVVALFGRSVHEVASRDYSPAQISAWAPQTPDLSEWTERLSKGTVFVCECENQLVGFIRIEKDGCLDLLYVHSQFQRQGVAQTLFERALVWASNQGLRRLTSDVSITARPFFEHVGFRVVRSQTIEHRGVSIQNFQMELDKV